MSVVAYVLVQTETGKVWDISKEALKIKGVKAAHAVTGIYDVIIYMEAANLETLKDQLAKIHDIEGIQRTQTAVSL
jgi:DNA-binding Lrp family transcriptional regulator